MLNGSAIAPIRVLYAAIALQIFCSLAPAQEPTTVHDTTGANLEASIAKLLGDSLQPVGRTAGAAPSTNPRISVIGSFVANKTSNGATAKSIDLGLSETEISFQSHVDPYAKADFYVAFGRESEDPFFGPDAAVAADGEYHAELEEAYLTTLSLPFALQLKAGKFRSDFGRINQFHPHALAFTDMPRMYVNFLGEEGLADRGVSLSWLVPNPLGFYQEVGLEVTSGALEGPSFEGGSDNLLYVGNMKSFFDLSDHTTLELGLTGLHGANGEDGRKTRMGAFDATIKWKPLRRNRYHSFEWTTEMLFSDRNDSAGSVRSKGFYSFANYQFAKRWFIGGRYDYSEFPDNPDASEKAYSAVLSFYATEFQKIEVQYQYGDPATGDNFQRVMARLVFVIGAHGAHQY